MPTYEFRCPQGHEFEKLYRTISGAEVRALCPECGQSAERMMSASGFAFKGSGFYLTDYGKNAHRDKGTPEPKSGAAAGEGGASDGGKPDAKPDAAAATGGAATPAAETTKAAPKSEPKGEPKRESKRESKGESRRASKAEPTPAAAPVKKKSADE